MNINTITISHLDNPAATLSAQDFQKYYVQTSQPLILRRFDEQWPAKQWHIDYLVSPEKYRF